MRSPFYAHNRIFPGGFTLIGERFQFHIAQSYYALKMSFTWKKGNILFFAIAQGMNLLVGLPY